MTLAKLVLVASLATASSVAMAAPAAAPLARAAEFKAQADALLEAAYAADGPGAAVIVTRRGRVVYSASRGLADLETKRPITLDTPFKLGSIVKQFTAATVLQLVAEGKISLDDPISRFFPDFPPPSAGATVRQLLNHSSGIQDYSKIPGWIAREGRRPHTTAELVAQVTGRPAKSEPGKAWEYNNAGYMLLGAIVEKVTGKAWHEVVADRIARPLGLETLLFAGSPQADRLMALGYGEDEGRQKRALGGHPTVAHAAGGLVASASDLARWAQALHHGQVVSPALYREMTGPALLGDGKVRPYGFGLRLQKFRGRLVLVHGGAGAGLDTDSVYIPSEDVYVAVLSNTDDSALDSSTLTRRLAAMALGEPIPTFTRTEVPASAVEPFFGAYRAEGARPLTFHGRDGKLYLSHGEEEMEAFAAGEDRFFFGPDKLAWIRFVRQPDGSPVMELHEPEAAQPGRAVRTGSVPQALAIDPVVLRSYVGNYQTETLAVTVALGGDGRLTIQPEKGPPMAMRPVSQTEFRVDSGGFRLVFHPENGRVDRFTMYRGARELHGKRSAP